MPPETSPRTWGLNASFTRPGDKPERPAQPSQPPPQVTVIAAVWQHQADQLDLLRGHMENLDRQSVPVERIYVFDGGGVAPDWLKGMSISINAPLTIYQSWNAAISLVQTPLVMNLNLDDRLAVDGVERLSQAALSDPEVFLVGGDWNICPSQAQTDAIEYAYSIEGLPPSVVWPPAAGIEARLGTGDGHSGSFGPASLWRMEALKWMPRYPFRFEDGSLIKVIGDAVWWHLIQNHAQKKTARLPLVIGHYRTWPESQAEFRNPGQAEMQKPFSLL